MTIETTKIARDQLHILIDLSRYMPWSMTILLGEADFEFGANLNLEPNFFQILKPYPSLSCWI